MAYMTMEMVEVANLMDVFGAESCWNFHVGHSVEGVEREINVIHA